MLAVATPAWGPGRGGPRGRGRRGGAGLAPLEALRAATLLPARVFGLEDWLGTVAVGKLADLVLLEANPLEAIANTRRIRAVVTNGRLFRRADLDRLLAAAEESNQQSEKQEYGEDYWKRLGLRLHRKFYSRFRRPRPEANCRYFA